MTDHRDPLDRLADLTFPAPDAARMRADIARARARFTDAGLPSAPLRPAGWWAWLTSRRFGLAGSVLAGVAAVFLLLPFGQFRGDNSRDAAEAGYPAPASAGAAGEGSVAIAETAPAPSKSAAAGTSGVSLPPLTEAAPAVPPLAAAPPPPVATAQPPVATAQPGVTTLPRLGARPARPATSDTALVDLEREEENDVFSGSASFSISADQDGMWLERPTGQLEIPLGDLPPDMGLLMSELFMLPARGGLPQFLVLRGQQGDHLSWQIFRVEDDAVSYDRVITGIVKDARTAGQVEGMIRRLPPPD